MKIVVLAGGLGTRLRQVVKNAPKPMADVGGSPFLELLLDNLLVYGADEFILCVSYMREVIQARFGDAFRGVPVRYSVEEELLGTGGAVKQAFDLFGLDEALVVNGDTFVQADYRRFWDEFAGEPLAVMLKAVDNADRYGRVESRDGRVVSFREKSDEGRPGLINAGVYRVRSELFAGLPQRFSLEKDLLEPRVAELRPRFFLADDYFIDIGVPESYARACRELPSLVLRNRTTTVSSLRECESLLAPAPDGKTPALFLDRDGVINVDKNYVYRIEDCEFVDGIFELCCKAKEMGYKLIVVTNQAGIAKGYFTERDYATFMDYVRGEFEKRGCPLDDVYYCPFHEDGIGEYRKDSEDRKPNPGMILKAAARHGVALRSSILIGDKESDVEAGRRAGVETLILYLNKNKGGYR